MRRRINPGYEQVIPSALLPIRSESNETAVAADRWLWHRPVTGRVRFEIYRTARVTNATNALAAVERDLKNFVFVNTAVGKIDCRIAERADRDPIFVISQHRAVKVFGPIAHAVFTANRGAKVKNVTRRVRRTHPPPGDAVEVIIESDDTIRAQVAMAGPIVRRAIENLDQSARIKI